MLQDKKFYDTTETPKRKVDARELGTALGHAMWPNQYEHVISLLFVKGSAGYSMALRYADIVFNRRMDEEAEQDEYIQSIHEIA